MAETEYEELKTFTGWTQDLVHLASEFADLINDKGLREIEAEDQLDQSTRRVRVRR